MAMRNRDGMVEPTVQSITAAANGSTGTANSHREELDQAIQFLDACLAQFETQRSA